MMRDYYFTSITLNYVPKARVLAQTLKRHNCKRIKNGRRLIQNEKKRQPTMMTSKHLEVNTLKIVQCMSHWNRV